MRIDFKVLNRKYTFNLVSRDVRTQYVAGYTNRTKDGYYIITLDYDSMMFEDVHNELERLQEDHGLSDFFIFSSSREKGKQEEGYHAVCLDKVPLMQLLEIMSQTSVDPLYQRVPMMSGKKLWVLRVTDKNDNDVRFVGKVKSKNGKFDDIYEKSNAHRKLLNNLFNLDIEYNALYDSHSEVKLARYPV